MNLSSLSLADLHNTTQAVQNNKQFRKNRYHNRNQSDMEVLITSPDMLQLSNIQQINDHQLRIENRYLTNTLKKLNDTLNAKVQKKRYRIKSIGASVSMRQFMQYVPQDIDEQLRKNTQIICQLKKQFQTFTLRRNIIEKTQHKIQMDIKADKINSEIKHKGSSIKQMRRKFIIKQKQIKTKQRSNQQQKILQIRRQLIRITQNNQLLSIQFSQKQLQNRQMNLKLQSLVVKQSQTHQQFKIDEIIHNELDQQISKVNRINESYLYNLNRLRSLKSKQNSNDQSIKIKYLESLKRLETQHIKFLKIDNQIQLIETNINKSKLTIEQLSNKIKSKKKSLYTQSTKKQSFLLTGIQTSCRGNQSQFFELSKTSILDKQQIKDGND